MLDDRDGTARRGRTRHGGRRPCPCSCCTTSPCRAAARPRRGRPCRRRRARRAGAGSRRSAGCSCAPRSRPRKSGKLRVVGGRVGATANQEATATSYAAVCWKASAASRLRAVRSKPPSCDRGEHVGVPRRAGDDRDGRVVLGGGADHRRAADVDLLDALVGRGAGGDGLAERVEVDDDQVERLDAQLGELLPVVLQAQVGEDARRAPCGCRVLTRPSRHSGKPVSSSTLVTGTPAAAMRRGGGPGGDELDARLVQAAGELFEARLVVDADERPTDGPLAALGRDSAVGGHWITTFRPSMR